MSHSHRINFIILLTLLIVAFGLRVYRLDKSPASINWDEAALGYNAYSLIYTGRDEFAKPFPISLRSFDDYKPALYSYLATVPISISGLSETSTRLTSALFGTLAVFFVTYLAIYSTRRFSLALIAAFIAATSPILIHFSRIAFESNVGSSLLLAALSCLLAAKRHSKFIYPAIFLAVVSMYAYHSTRAIAVPLLFCIYWFNKNSLKFSFKSLLLGAGIFCLALLPLGYSFLTEPAASRLSSTIIFKLWPFVPTDFPISLFSPVYALIWQLTGQFLSYFSPTNLFLRGSSEPILQIPDVGLFSIELIVFYLLGLAYTLKSPSTKKLLLPLLIIVPLPAVITWNWFSVIRTSTHYYVLTITIAIGIYYLLHHIKSVVPRLLTSVLLGLILIFSAWYTSMTIWFHAPVKTSGDFQPGFEQSIPYLLETAQNYDRVIIESPHIAPYIFLLFYGQYPPARYLLETGPNRQNSGTENYAFGKFEFRNLTKYDVFGSNILIMGPTTSVPDWRKSQAEAMGLKVKDIYDNHGHISFRIISL